MLGEVVVDDEGVLALPHELFAHRAAGVGREVLHRRGVGGVGGDDDGVFHRAVFFEKRYRLRYLADLLAYGDIDADEVAALLVDDAVESDCGLASGAVADDKLALPATDGNHRVDCLDPGLNRRVNGASDSHVGGNDFNFSRAARVDGALAVDGLPESVHDAPDKLLADRHDNNAAGASDFRAFLHGEGIAENHGADAVFFKVERHAHDAALELKQLGIGDSRQAVNLRYAVTDFNDCADINHAQVAPELFNLAPDYRSNILSSDCHAGPP